MDCGTDTPTTMLLAYVVAVVGEMLSTMPDEPPPPQAGSKTVIASMRKFHREPDPALVDGAFMKSTSARTQRCAGRLSAPGPAFQGAGMRTAEMLDVPAL